MTPLAFKTTPTPSEMAFDPLPQISSFLSYSDVFFLEKKILEEKKFSPAGAGTSFCPKTPKSAIKKFLSTPLQPHPENFFYDPPP